MRCISRSHITENLREVGNWEALTDLLPPEMEEKIATFTIRERQRRTKIIGFGGSIAMETSQLTLTYKAMSKDLWLQEDKAWRQIWQLAAPNLMRALIWMIKHQKLMCNVERKNKGLHY